MFDRFTDRARRVLGLARQEAGRLNHDYLGTEHVLLGLVGEPDGVAARVLTSLGVDLKNLRHEVEKRVPPGTGLATFGQLPFTPHAKKVLELALEEASQLGHRYIGSQHLLLGLLREREGLAAEVLRPLKVVLEDLRPVVLAVSDEEPAAAAPAPPRTPPPTSGETDEPRPATVPRSVTPTLDAYTDDLTARFDEAPPCAVGRDAVLDRVVDVLHRRTRRNVVLVGPPGVGKTTIVDELARRVAAGVVGGRLANARVLRLDLPLLVSGTKFRGQLEDRARAVVTDARRAPKVVLHVEDARLLATSGFGVESMTVAEALGPLVRGEVASLVLTATPQTVAPTLDRLGVRHLYTVVDVPEPDRTAARAMVAAHRDALSDHHRVAIADDALDAAVDVGGTLADRHLPSSALDLLDETCARVGHHGGDAEPTCVTAAAVRATAAARR